MLTSFKKKLLLLLFFTIIFIGFLGVKFIILDNQNTSGELKIVSTPAAGVFIDNVPKGDTPFDEKIKPGEYQIKLIPQKTATDTASWQGKVTVYKKAMTYVNRELGTSEVTSAGEIFTITKMDKQPENPDFGEITVETDPIGAIVYIDNDEKGMAPFNVERVMKGDHEVSVLMFGFLRRTQKVNVQPKFRTSVKFKLALDPSQQPTPAQPSPEASASATTSTAGSTKKTKVVIQQTPLGFLRVRSEPSTAGSELAQVKPGEKYDLLDEDNGWYKIKVGNVEGWVSSQYSTKEQE